VTLADPQIPVASEMGYQQ